MAFNYNTLVGPKATIGSIRNWLNWDKVASEDVLEQAQAYIYSQLRIREMKMVTTGTIAMAATQLAMPATFLQAISFRLTGSYAQEVVVWEERDFENQIQLDDNSAYIEDAPNGCMIIGEPAIAYFNYAAIADIPYRIVYYGRPASLASGVQTNWLTTRYPSLLRYAAMGFAYEYKQDEAKADRYLKLCEGLIEKANAEADMAKDITRHEPFNHSNE